MVTSSTVPKGSGPVLSTGKRISGTVLMLLCGLLIAALPTDTLAQDPSLDAYIGFLQDQPASARDYVLGLFQDHDIVMLCERDHRDITQYDLFLSIIGDERFIRDVGNVFTEIGASTLNPALNEFLHADNLPADSVDHGVLNFHRNLNWTPLWEKQNYSFFLHGVYEINRGLPAASKISVYPSDMPFDWSQIDSAGLAAYLSTLGNRDSVMAAQIIDQLEQIRQSSSARKKALVIMNYRHGFNRHFESPSGGIRDNVGGYLAARYGNRLANVYVNFERVTVDSAGEFAGMLAVDDGRWDAAFEIMGLEDAGFDFAGSPFGATRFDVWPFFNHSLTFQDVFTGLAYYRSPDEWKAVIGVSGIVDSAFLPELLRRERLTAMVGGRDPGSVVDTAAIVEGYNNQREFSIPVPDSLKAQIEQWLK